MAGVVLRVITAIKRGKLSMARQINQKVVGVQLTFSPKCLSITAIPAPSHYCSYAMPVEKNIFFSTVIQKKKKKRMIKKNTLATETPQTCPFQHRTV